MPVIGAGLVSPPHTPVARWGGGHRCDAWLLVLSQSTCGRSLILGAIGVDWRQLREIEPILSIAWVNGGPFCIGLVARWFFPAVRLFMLVYS